MHPLPALMDMANEEVDVMPTAAALSDGVHGNKVTEIPKDGIKDFIKSIIVSDPDTKEPFFVLDLGLVKSLMDKWTKNLPTVLPFYAVKCNPDPCFVAYMASLGANFDCASQAEIQLVISLGISPDRIIFASPCKLESHMRYAARVGVRRTTFDSIYEVEKMKRCFPGCQLLIRVIAPDDGSAKLPLGVKYGALPHEVEPLLIAAQTVGLDVVGVSFHVGSGTTDCTAYHSAISAARDVFDTADKLGLPKMRLLNIGGGFSAGPIFEGATEAVKFGIQNYFQDRIGLEIIAEPGRYFAEWPFTLVANVIGKRVKGELRDYYINDGVYGSLSCILSDHAVATIEPILMVLQSNPPDNPTGSGSKTHESTVFGPTCAALDMVAKDYQLPDMEIGDWLVFPNMGAYSAACASNFNGFKGVGISTHLVYSKHF